jgi:hypothetical protein
VPDPALRIRNPLTIDLLVTMFRSGTNPKSSAAQRFRQLSGGYRRAGAIASRAAQLAGTA